MGHALSAEVALRPTPDHTPGHVSVTIDSRGGVYAPMKTKGYIETDADGYQLKIGS